ncbi:THAP-type domain-containing protein [Aphis craccivora]|uniref:THAP-type domain-containing protein n=1 Tax=Aphis craccivora TaxID=307492 RepID=A0A6G0YD68_APHCR|nr:THAP-type domain-containing protein [Aphis craccivora]
MEEMAIRQNLEYDGTNYYGYIDLSNGLRSDSLEIAKECFVLMVVSINENWKIPFGYLLVSKLNSSQKSLLYDKLVLKVNNIQTFNTDNCIPLEHMEILHYSSSDPIKVINNSSSNNFDVISSEENSAVDNFITDHYPKQLYN